MKYSDLLAENGKFFIVPDFIQRPHPYRRMELLYDYCAFAAWYADAL